MTLFHAPSVQSPAAYSGQNLAGNQLATRMAATASAAQRLNLRTAWQDGSNLFKISAFETAAPASLVDANLTFGYEIGNVLRYGADPTGAADSANAFLKAQQVATASGAPLIIPGGTYKSSATLAWGFTNLTVISTGQATINFTNPGQCITIDAGVGPTGTLYGITVRGWIRVVGNINTTDAWFVRACHHLWIEARAGDCIAAFRVEWSVLSVFKVVCSVNEAPFTVLTPSAGIILDQRVSDAGATATCTLLEPIIEGITGGSGVGLDLENCLQIAVLGGTFESCRIGARTSVGHTVLGVTFYETDFELNSVNDFVMSGGAGILFDSCNISSGATSAPNVDFQAGSGLEFVGGFLRWLNLQLDGATLFGTQVSNGVTVGIQANTHQYTALGIQQVDGNRLVTGKVPDSVGEVGTFTPAVAGGTVAGTQTYTTRQGAYTRVGSLVQMQLALTLATNGGGGTGPATFSGFPFSARASGGQQSFPVVNMTGVTFPAGQSLALVFNAASNTAILIVTDTAANVVVPITSLAATASFNVTIALQI